MTKTAATTRPASGLRRRLARGVWSGAWLFALLLPCLPPAALGAAPERSLTLHLVDLGTGQNGTGQNGFGQNGFGRGGTGSGPRSLAASPEQGQRFSGVSGETALVVVSMPEEQMRNDIDVPRLRASINDRLRDQVDAQLARGASQIELRLVPGICAGPSCLGLSREQREGVANFGQAAYGAVADLVRHSAKRLDDLAVDATLGADGVQVFAAAHSAWAGISDEIERVTWVDARVREADARAAIEALGDARLRIINTVADAPSLPEDTRSWLDSMASSMLSLTLLRDYPALTVLKLEGHGLLWPAQGASGALTSPDAQYEVLHYGPGYQFSRLGSWTGAELHPALSVRDYRAYAGHVPAVGTAPNAPGGPQAVGYELSSIDFPAVALTEQGLLQLAENADLLADVMQHMLGAAGPGEHLEETKKLVEGVQKLQANVAADLRLIQQQGRGAILHAKTLHQALQVAYDILTSRKTFSAWTKKLPGLGTVASGRLFVATLGVDDIVAGTYQASRSGQVTPETWEVLLSGVNKIAWGALGYVATGTMQGAKGAAEFGDTAGRLGRYLLAKPTARWYAWSTGADQALLENYMQVQEARRQMGKSARTIEAFMDFKADALALLSEQQRADANRRFGLAPDHWKRQRPGRVRVVRRTHSHYREVCQQGQCERIDLPAAVAAPRALPTAVTEPSPPGLQRGLPPSFPAAPAVSGHSGSGPSIGLSAAVGPSAANPSAGGVLMQPSELRKVAPPGPPPSAPLPSQGRPGSAASWPLGD